MSLASGSRLGPYEIVSPLGAGGLARKLTAVANGRAPTRGWHMSTYMLAYFDEENYSVS
jgi:hypothetical protein